MPGAWTGLQVTYATTMGQNLDMLTAPDGVDNFDAYDMARYCQIVKFKVGGGTPRAGGVGEVGRSAVYSLV